MEFPTVNEIREWTEQERDAFARKLKTDADKEQFSDILIRIHEGHRMGAHSETADTPRNRKHAHLQPINEDVLAIANSIDNAELEGILCRLAQQGLKKRMRQVFLLSTYYGLRQRDIAKVLKIKQPAVSRILGRAKKMVYRLADEDSAAVQVMRYERSKGYFAPGYRPDLPEELEAARQEIERAEAMTTHIIDPYSQSLEVWNDEDGREKVDSSGNKTRKPYKKMGFGVAMRKGSGGLRVESGE